MNINPFENTKIYGLDKYFNEIISLYGNNKMPNKILLSGKRGVGKATLAYHIINYFLSESEDYRYDYSKFTINNKNRSYKLIQNNTHPNFYLIDLIDEKKNINITQIREMITYTNKSSFNDTPRFILIDNVENLNRNSVNALLKIIEEPNENIFFILIHNNATKILPTLKSRCLIFNIYLSFDETLAISNLLLGQSIFKIINYELISYYNTPGEFIGLIDFANEKKIDLKEYTLKNILILLIDKAYYKKNKIVKNLIINFIELYFLKEYSVSKSKNSLFNIYHNLIDKIHNTKKFNLDEESLFFEFKSKLLK